MTEPTDEELRDMRRIYDNQEERIAEAESTIGQQAQRIAELEAERDSWRRVCERLEAENARLRANSFAAAVEACRNEALTLQSGGEHEQGWEFRRVANWLFQQASQGKKDEA